MHLFLQMDLAGPPPPAMAPILARSARVDGARISFLAAETMSWPRFFDSLRRHGATIAADPHLHSLVTDYSWATDPGATAAVLGPVELYRASNPPEDYDPRLPAPHLGYLPLDRDLVIPEPPRGHLALVGQDLVMSARLARYVGRPASPVGQVVHDGHSVTGWSRVHVAATARVISAASLESPVACFGCGAVLRPRLGVWLGVDDPSSTADVAADEQGYDHLERRHPIVVSVERARFLARELRTGINVEPVFGCDSMIGRQVEGFLRGVASLPRATR